MLLLTTVSVDRRIRGRGAVRSPLPAGGAFCPFHRLRRPNQREGSDPARSGRIPRHTVHRQDGIERFYESELHGRVGYEEVETARSWRWSASRASTRTCSPPASASRSIPRCVIPSTGRCSTACCAGCTRRARRSSRRWRLAAWTAA